MLPKLDGQHLLVGVARWEPYYRKEIQEDGVERPTGIAVEVLQTLAQSMNFTYSFVTASDGIWGTVFPNGSVGGILGLAYRQEVDFSLGPFTVTSERSKKVDFSTPISMDVFTTFLPRPKLEKDLGSFLKPFKFEVWLALLFAIIMSTILGLTVDYFNRKRYPKNDEHFFKGLWILRIMTTDMIPQLPSENPGRIFIGTWMLSGILFITSYSGVLISLLTSRKVDIPINSLKELVDYGDMPFASQYGTALYNDFMNAESGLYKEVRDKMKVVTDCHTDIDKIIIDKWAIICDILSMKIIMHEDFSANAKCQFYIVQEPIYTVLLSFGFPKNSPILPKFNSWINILRDTGLIEKSIQNATPNATACLRKPGWELRNQISTLDLQDMEGCFLFLASGLSLASLVFLMELLFHLIWKCKNEI